MTHAPHSSATLSGRDLARKRRAALASQGRSALATVSTLSRRVQSAVHAPRISVAETMAEQEPAAGDCGCGFNGNAGGCSTIASPRMMPASRKAVSAPPSGRELARARREALARDGKSGLQRVAQATRIAATMPTSDWQAALQKGASGRQLAMQRRLVQSLTGRVAQDSATSVRPTGRVRTRPTSTTSAQTAASQTLAGQVVTGTQVGRNQRVTGNEPGSCKAITGDEYLGGEYYRQFCDALPGAQAPKVTLSQTQGGSTVSGATLSPGQRITGNETGVCRGITGTQYLTREEGEQCGSVKLSVPHKVSIMSSRGKQTVSGTSLTNSERVVTGAEAGAQRSVTGSQYALSMGVSVPVRSGVATRRGTPDRQEASWHSQSLTGDSPGTGGGRITGDERGACEPVTGTGYVGPDNLHASCSVSREWLTRFPSAGQRPAVPAPLDFSVQSPARQAWDRREQSVTVAAMDNGDRITGPGNKARGLITGTPEFRHGTSSRVPQEAAPALAVQRLTGEGSQAGVRVTGDAWGMNNRVTGNEGASVLARNLSQRGQPRGAGVTARDALDQARTEAPLSRITGSSGNTGRGALITVSGGARG